MDAHCAILAIQELLDGTEWNSNTLSEIAEIMMNAGYRIRGGSYRFELERDES